MWSTGDDAPDDPAWGKDRVVDLEILVGPAINNQDMRETVDLVPDNMGCNTMIQDVVLFLEFKQLVQAQVFEKGFFMLGQAMLHEGQIFS